MPDPKCGAVHLKPDRTQPFYRVIQLWNSNRKPAAHQYLNEIQLRMLRDECDAALAEIEAAHENARQLADKILGKTTEI